MTSSPHNCMLAAEAWASGVCAHAWARMRAWECLSTKCICSQILRRQHMFIMGVDQQGSWDSSPWALAEILNPCTWRSGGYQSRAVKVVGNRVHSHPLALKGSCASCGWTPSALRRRRRRRKRAFTTGQSNKWHVASGVIKGFLQNHWFKTIIIL